MSDPRLLSYERLAEIREQNRPPTLPVPCPVCGAARQLGAIDSGAALWACYGPTGTSARSVEHYERSKVVLPLPSPLVVELLAHIDAQAEARAAERARDEGLRVAFAQAVEAVGHLLETYNPDGLDDPGPGIATDLERWRALGTAAAGEGEV